MRIGARFQESDPELLAEIAVTAEELGFESLWRGEHVAVTREIRSIDPYYARALPPRIESFSVLDPAIIYSFVAARTSTIRLGLGAFLLPLRHPVEAARMLMTLDVVSAGRVEIAVGMGWLREEFEVLGQGWARRGARTEEAIAVMRAMWTQPHPQHDGKHFHVPPMVFVPKPVQRPHPPILISGVSPVAFDRAARIGDGWYSHDLTPAEARRHIRELNRLREQHGRDGDRFEVTTRTHRAAPLSEVEQLAEEGVHRVVFDIGSVDSDGKDGVLRNLERIHTDIIAKL